jgi:hypothetical protein
MHKITAPALLLIGLLPQTFCHASDSDTILLKINPFMRPTYKQDVFADQNSMAGNASADSMQLRGIMLANSNSVANIDGKIISIGQQIHGYTLVSVERRQVLLDRNGTLITLSIDHEPVGND